MSDDSNADRAVVGDSEAANIAAWIERVRTVPRLRWPALAIAAAVGVALAWAHWLGLVAGGALVGLLSRSLPRALLAASDSASWSPLCSHSRWGRPGDCPR